MDESTCVFGRFKKGLKETTIEAIWGTFSDENDRALAIVAACHLDNLLEKLICSAYIKDPHVKSIFKDNNILQSFFAKINIAYFSGLIPKFIYHDLKLVCEIRNRFAHEVTSGLRFTDDAISNRINKCELRPRTLDNVSAPRLKFMIVVTQIGTLLQALERTLSHLAPPSIMDLCDFLNKLPYEEMALTKKEIVNVIKKERAKSLRKKKKIVTT
jgi:DNA-binding MltR family transcriptional regulator